MYAFCRVSTGRGCSLEYQEKKINDYLKDTPATQTVKCVGSAYKKDNPTLINFSLRKNCKFVFYAVDRFSRNFDKGSALAAEFLRNGNILHFVSDNLTLTGFNSDWDRFLILLREAENESIKISRRVRDAKQYMKDLRIKQFVDLCRSKNTNLTDINDVLSKLTRDKSPIELSDGADVLKNKLKYSNIAKLLNDYSVGAADWTKQSVKLIRKN